MPTIKDLTDPTMLRQLETIRSAPPDSTLYKANQHLLDDSGEVWEGGGSLHFSGAFSWTAECELIFSDEESVLFSASGTGLALGTFTCEITGTFVVDPSTVGGSCNFNLGVGALGAGAVVLVLGGTNGTWYGNFTGSATGVGDASVHGTGSLKVG